jgi:hypothetical protein
MKKKKTCTCEHRAQTFSRFPISMLPPFAFFRAKQPQSDDEVIAQRWQSDHIAMAERLQSEGKAIAQLWQSEGKATRNRLPIVQRW